MWQPFIVDISLEEKDKWDIFSRRKSLNLMSLWKCGVETDELRTTFLCALPILIIFFAHHFNWDHLMWCVHLFQFVHLYANEWMRIACVHTSQWSDVHSSHTTFKLNICVCVCEAMCMIRCVLKIPKIIYYILLFLFSLVRCASKRVKWYMNGVRGMKTQWYAVTFSEIEM